MHSQLPRVLVYLLLLGLLVTCRGQKINVLLTGKVDVEANPLIKWFEHEPSVDATAVITRPSGLITDGDIKRFVRLYFPRNYQEIKESDLIILHSPELYHLTREQDKWMHDIIEEGAGGLVAPAGLSDHGDIQYAWVNSMVQAAFPNDFAAVLASGGRAGERYFHIEVNRDFQEPVLTPFISLGIENFLGRSAPRMVPREGSRTLAWSIGASMGKIPYLISWDYDKGRGMTLADSLHSTFWSDYLSLSNPAFEKTQNPYGLDILMNMVLYLTGRNLPADVLVVHNLRANFLEYRIKMSLLISLANFAEKFGADSTRIARLVQPIDEKFQGAEERYLTQDFEECERMMNSIFEDLTRAEIEVVKIKDSVLMWIYVVEWLTVMGTIMFSSFVLWTFMVRRKLYRQVGTTQLERRNEI